MDQTLSSLLTKHQPAKEEVEANPWDAIPIKNSKQAKETTELHLADRKATVLVHFNHFPNLQILWINRNHLTSLRGLEKNFRIKHLFCQQNKIKSIEGIFENLKHIETLIIYDNELRDLDKIMKSLKPLTSMKTLQLFDNPAAHEPNYKMRVLNDLPNLEIFDRHKVSIVEKDEAMKFMNQAKGKNKNHRPFAY